MYHIGQFRRTQVDSYIKNLEYASQEYLPTTRTTASQLIFQNPCITFTGSNELNNQNCYYLRFSINKLNSKQTFYLKACAVQSDESSKKVINEQLIKEYEVEAIDISNPKDTSVYFETIISPSDTYNTILWELQRTVDDYKMNNDSTVQGRIMNVNVIQFGQLIDIIPWLANRYNGLTSLKKIGIQGPPSLLMCINKEEIRIGRSGIYEINNGITITSISFVPKITANNGLDYFIMDFEY